MRPIGSMFTARRTFASLTAAAVLLTGCSTSDTSAEPAEQSADSAASAAAPTTSAPAAPSQSPSDAAPDTPHTSEPDESGPAESGAPANSGERDRTALTVLASLPVKGRAPMTGYDRDEFGPSWADADRNGCDTRNDILQRDLTELVFEPGTRECVVTSGVLEDPYTTEEIDFVRGDGNLVDIDHVVALGNGWVTGAFRFPIKKAAAFANDPLNLLAVDAGANRSKGDADAATWLPSNKPFRCAYVSRQIAVKEKYKLWVTAPEKAAMERVLGGCPDQEVTEDVTDAPVRAPLNLTEPSDEPTDEPASGSGGGSGGGSGAVYYENCDAAREAGAAPVRRGDPGYGSHLDRDGDGSACE